MSDASKSACKNTQRNPLIDRRSPFTVPTWAAAAAVDPLRRLLEPTKAHFIEEGGANECTPNATMNAHKTDFGCVSQLKCCNGATCTDVGSGYKNKLQ